jgi:photosystem II cytochrome c550
MFKKSIWLVAVVIFLATQLFFSGGAIAAELDAATRTIKLNDAGETITLTPQQVVLGKRMFNYACGQCHVGGVTKTDPNVGLDPETLSLATPSRNSLEALVDYMHNPTTFDGQESIAEVHPSTQSSDIFPKMRNLTDEDLTAIAGHILLQPKIVGQKWGGGKIYY